MIRVLVVEDDELTAAAHAEYVRRLDGFEVAGIAATAGAALAAIGASRAAQPIDLVLLDMNLPDGHGIDLARRVRAAGVTVDIIAITAVRDIDVVRGAVSAGIAQYLIKPFSFATFREKLGHYTDYREKLAASPGAATQSEVDAMLGALRAPTVAPLPKGLSQPTHEAVLDHLRAAGRPLSALELAEPLHLSRVTARRYLEHIADSGQATRSPRYGSPGRPELEYRLIG